MINKGYNDYELIYMIKEHSDSLAFNILLKKYEKFIYKRIHYYFFYESYYEDYFQEGIICLNKAVESFQTKFNKTFMRYFEVIIDRRFIQLHLQNKKEWKFFKNYKELIIVEESNDCYYDFDFEVISFKSEIEEKIYRYYYLENKTISYISKELSLNSKQVYNAIYRIKNKLKSLDNNQ